MLCREFGIEAFATAGSPDKCAAIRDLGGEAINYRDEDFAAGIAEKTAGQGVNVILDIMGGSYLNSNVSALAMDGRLVMLGFLGGARANDVDLLGIMSKRATITGSLMRPRTNSEKASIAEHQTIVRSLRLGDFAQTELLMARHVNDAFVRLEETSQLETAP